MAIKRAVQSGRAFSEDEMGIQDLSRSRSPMYMIALSDLHEKPGWNCRDDDDPANLEHVKSIAQTIAYNGVIGLDPLTIWLEDGKAYVSNGHCRLKAARYAVEHLGAQIVGLNCITEGKGATEADRKFSQISRNSGKPLTPAEYARPIRDLIAYGWTVQEVAQKSGRSVKDINAALDMLEAPPLVQKLVASGRVKPSIAVRTIKEHGETEGAKLLANAVDTAVQQGRQTATARDIGKEPKARVSKLKRVAEIIDAAEFDDEYAEGMRAIVVSDSAWRELQDLLGV